MSVHTVDWSDIELALQNAIESASGLPDSNVIWANQSGTQVARPCIVMATDGPFVVGIDAARHEYESGNPNGSQIVLINQGVRELTLRLQCFSDSVIGDNTARAILSKVQSKLGLETIRDTLWLAGLSIFDKGQVTYIPEIIGTKFEARCALNLRLYFTDEVSETATLIETVEATDETIPNTFQIPES